MARYVVAVSGASGIILAYRTVVALGDLGCEVELVMTQHALYAATLEMGKEFSSPQKFVSSVKANVKLHSIHDVGSTICSGSYTTDGMIIIPCSMSTVAALSVGLADNCLRRAADVTLKERRPLVIVPREAPLSALHLENMLKLTHLGAVIVPPVPAWYNAPQTLEEVENFIVGKALDVFKLEHNLYKRWGSD